MSPMTDRKRNRLLRALDDIEDEAYALHQAGDLAAAKNIRRARLVLRKFVEEHVEAYNNGPEVRAREQNCARIDAKKRAERKKCSLSS